MKKNFFVVLFLLFFTSIPLSAGNPKTITVVSDDNYPPYIFKDADGHLQGILVDQWKLWEEKTSVRVELKAMDWNEAQKTMKEGGADVIDTLFYTPERALIYDFTKPYATLSVPVFFNKNLQSITSIQELQGFFIGVKAGDACIDQLKKRGGSAFQEFSNYESIVRAAVENKIYVFCVDEPPALYYLYKMKAEENFRSSFSLYTGEFHRAVAKGRKDILSLVETGFSRISKEEYRKIDDKWLGISLKKPAYYAYLPYIFTGIAFLFFNLLIGNAFLKRKVTRKTFELKQAMDVLKESEEKYRRFIHNSLDGIILTDERGRVVEYNRALELITAMESGEALGRFIWELAAEGENNGYRDSLKRFFETGESTWVGKNLDREITDRQGNRKSIQTVFFPIQIPRGFFLGGIIRDVTERKKVEAELFSSQALYSKIFDNSPDPIFLVDVLPDNRFRVVATNPAQMRFLGIPPEKHWGKTLEEFLPENMARDVNRHYSECVRRNQDMVYEEGVGPPVNKYFQTKLALIREKTGKIIQIIGTTRDITERRKMEESLKKSEAKNKALLATNPDIMFILSREGVFKDYKTDNPNNLYISPELFLGKKLEEVLPSDVTEITFQAMRKLLQTGESQAYDYFLKIAGKTEYFDARMVFYGSDEILVSVRNMTEKRKFQEERQKANKLESIGILAGGIAHDFNNILTSIIGNISLASLDLSAGRDPSELLLEAEKAGVRARNLTSQLLTFSKGGAPVKEDADINDIIRESTDFILRGSKVVPEYHLAPDLLISQVDRGQISQVIQNLIINANQAMPEGGKLEISSGNMELNESNVFGLSSGAYIRIAIRDHGVGIEEKNLKNIFDPYFTTKKQGSGLGLAVCYSIIQKHNGAIDVQSAPGKGAVFTFFLPAIKNSENVQKKKGEAIPVEAEVQKKIKILFMDDEIALRNLAKAIFSGFGYEYELAEEGSEAIEAYRKALEKREPFDLVILDLTVPGGMGGREVISMLLEKDPGAKVIVTSGYSNDEVISDYQAYGFKGRIIKPFTVKDAMQEINRVLQNG